MMVRRDPLNKSERSQQMRLVRSKNTRPEMVVRKAVWGMGYRYRLHTPDVPGRPDIVFRKRRKAIFVHGCFWHRHDGCVRNRTPKTRVYFWKKKFRENVARDRHVRNKLLRRGWKILVIWECMSEKRAALEARLHSFLETPN